MPISKKQCEKLFQKIAEEKEAGQDEPDIKIVHREIELTKKEQKRDFQEEIGEWHSYDGLSYARPMQDNDGVMISLEINSDGEHICIAEDEDIGVSE